MNYAEEKVTLNFGLRLTDAWALAQFCKYVKYQDCRYFACTEDEAQEMLYGIGALMNGLKEAGINI